MGSPTASCQRNDELPTANKHRGLKNKTDTMKIHRQIPGRTEGEFVLLCLSLHTSSSSTKQPDKMFTARPKSSPLSSHNMQNCTHTVKPAVGPRAEE